MSGRLRVVFVAVALAGCGEPARLPVEAGMGPEPTLPPPQNEPLPVVNVAPAVGWKSGEAPTPAAGIEVKIFAAQLDHPRWLYVLPNGDVLMAESNKQPDSDGPKGIKSWVMKKMQEKAGAGVPSADRITLLRDGDGDGTVEVRTVFLEDLRSPFGMALIGEQFYVANTDAVVRFQYTPDATRLDGPGETVVELPAGPINRHWTRNLSADPDGRWLYVTVGSNSNIGENGMDTEVGRAAVWRLDPRTGAHHIYASGLRNPNGLAWVPATGHLWTVVNERDEIGGDLVPDYMTAIEEGDFYGWPYSYFGDHVDERVKPQRPDLVAQAKVPDYALGAHTASLGLAYSDGNALPSAFHGGMFIGQHGSWNREPRSGYKVIFVPFAAGEPDGMPRDVLTGFLAPDGSARGRPVGVAFDRHGALLVADDVGNIVWRLTAAGADPGPGRRPETPERATEEEPNAR